MSYLSKTTNKKYKYEKTCLRLASSNVTAISIMPSVKPSKNISKFVLSKKCLN